MLRVPAGGGGGGGGGGGVMWELLEWADATHLSGDAVPITPDYEA